MSLSWTLLAVLVFFPVGLVLLFALGTDLPSRLAVWFASGFLMSQWMQVMIFVFTDRMAGHGGETKLNTLYFYHVKWTYVLAGAIVISGLVAVAVWLLCRDPNRLHFSWLVAVVGIALGLSQITGSSIPKFFGELSVGAFFLVGIFAERYFLSYPPGAVPPVHQLQSDALTSLGLLVALISIWSPFVLGFAGFLFRHYFAENPAMLQFQLTRYAAYVCWNLIGIGLVGWKTLQLLIAVRRGFS